MREFFLSIYSSDAISLGINRVNPIRIRNKDMLNTMFLGMKENSLVNNWAFDTLNSNSTGAGTLLTFDSKLRGVEADNCCMSLILTLTAWPWHPIPINRSESLSNGASGSVILLEYHKPIKFNVCTYYVVFMLIRLWSTKLWLIFSGTNIKHE